MYDIYKACTRHGLVVTVYCNILSRNCLLCIFIHSQSELVQNMKWKTPEGSSAYSLLWALLWEAGGNPVQSGLFLLGCNLSLFICPPCVIAQQLSSCLPLTLCLESHVPFVWLTGFWRNRKLVFATLESNLYLESSSACVFIASGGGNNSASGPALSEFIGRVSMGAGDCKLRCGWLFKRFPAHREVMLSMLMHSSSKDVFQAAAHALSTLLEQNGKAETTDFNTEKQFCAALPL